MVCGSSFEMPAGLTKAESLCDLVCRNEVSASAMPISRWPNQPVCNSNCDVNGACYGAFSRHQVYFDVTGFGISYSEARAMDPQMAMLLEVSKAALATMRS